MAAPVPNTRQFPTAMRLDDGHQSVIAWNSQADLAIFEKTLQVPATDNGDPIETSTMLNQEFETKAPQRLKGHDDGVVVAGFDPNARETIDDLVGLPDSISWWYPEGTGYVHWGYARRAEFSPLTKGEMPEVTISIVQTNWDPYNCAEAGPVYVDGTGSCGPAA